MGTYRGFIIARNPFTPPIPGWQKFQFGYVHKDYDGAPDANDNRHGYGPSVMACKQEIDDLLDEAAQVEA